VYALISVSDNASGKIVPDYSKSLLQLFLEVTSFLRSENSFIGHRYSAEIGSILQKRLGLQECEEATNALRRLKFHEESDMGHLQDKGDDRSPLLRMIDHHEGETMEALYYRAECLMVQGVDAECFEAECLREEFFTW
jgi:hypothetical protein